MMKHFKKLKKVTFATTAALLLLFTAANGTGKTITLPTITTEESEAEKPVIRPMNDDIQDVRKQAPEN